MVTIENEYLKVVIDPNGAHLKSIVFEGREYLWQGDPAVWPNRAPILFPVVARMRDKQYTVDGKVYTIEPHGFVKSSLLDITAQTPTSVTFTLCDSPETLAIYPFAFRFSVSFTLDGTKIIKRHVVENPAATPLYYEAGGHDGFNLPFNDGEMMDDCHIRLVGEDTITPYEQDETVTLLPKSRELTFPHGLISLKPAAYNLDCFVLDAPKSHRAELLDGKGNVKLALEFPMMDYVTLWSKPVDFDCNFVCIEPWSSLPDAHFVSHELKDKAGVRRLEGGQSETTGYDILFY